MKKFLVTALSFALIAAMFAGCRRNPETTGTTAAPPVTTKAPTAPATKPATKPAETTRPNGTGVLPDATDLMPSGTTEPSMTRSHRPPRY